MDLLYIPLSVSVDGNRMIQVLLFCRFVTAYSTLDLVQTPQWVNQPFSLKRYKQNTKFSLYLASQTSNISPYIYPNTALMFILALLPIVSE